MVLNSVGCTTGAAGLTAAVGAGSIEFNLAKRSLTQGVAVPCGYSLRYDSYSSLALAGWPDLSRAIPIHTCASCEYLLGGRFSVLLNAPTAAKGCPATVASCPLAISTAALPLASLIWSSSINVSGGVALTAPSAGSSMTGNAGKPSLGPS